MKEIVIISGKGGTGKTVLCASFAALAENAAVADCDVDAANLHLLLHPTVKKTHTFYGNKTARIIQENCTQCRECLNTCRFDAILSAGDEISIDPLSCEGCEVCSHICPTEAIVMEETISGEWFESETKYGDFIHARLGIAQENSGKLVTEVRKRSRELAKKNKRELILIDGPPGIGCPVIASLSGTTYALVVTEPTLSGMHDMKRVIETPVIFKLNQPAASINSTSIPKTLKRSSHGAGKSGSRCSGRSHLMKTSSALRSMAFPWWRCPRVRHPTKSEIYGLNSIFY